MRIPTLLLLLLALTGCGPAATPPATPIEPAVVEPQPPAIPWNPVGEVKTYDPSNLWDAINGAADGYLAYGFVRLTVQDYAGNGAKATVEVYDQGAPLNAFGVYRRDRPPESQPIAVGAEALISSPHHCAMLAGASYVQARALEGELDEASCRGLFSGLLATLPGPHDLPPELELLPTADRVAGSEGFTVASYLGVTELEDCLHAEYRAGGDASYKLFAFIETEGRNSAAIWSALEAKWDPVPATASPALRRTIPYTGEVVALRTPRGIIAVVGAGDLAASVELLESLVSD